MGKMDADVGCKVAALSVILRACPQAYLVLNTAQENKQLPVENFSKALLMELFALLCFSRNWAVYALQ